MCIRDRCTIVAFTPTVDVLAVGVIADGRFCYTVFLCILKDVYKRQVQRQALVIQLLHGLVSVRTLQKRALCVVAQPMPNDRKRYEMCIRDIDRIARLPHVCPKLFKQMQAGAVALNRVRV